MSTDDPFFQEMIEKARQMRPHRDALIRAARWQREGSSIRRVFARYEEMLACYPDARAWTYRLPDDLDAAAPDRLMQIFEDRSFNRSNDYLHRRQGRFETKFAEADFAATLRWPDAWLTKKGIQLELSFSCPAAPLPAREKQIASCLHDASLFSLIPERNYFVAVARLLYGCCGGEIGARPIVDLSADALPTYEAMLAAEQDYLVAWREAQDAYDREWPEPRRPPRQMSPETQQLWNALEARYIAMAKVQHTVIYRHVQAARAGERESLIREALEALRAALARQQQDEPAAYELKERLRRLGL